MAGVFQLLPVGSRPQLIGLIDTPAGYHLTSCEKSTALIAPHVRQGANLFAAEVHTLRSVTAGARHDLAVGGKGD